MPVEVTLRARRLASGPDYLHCPDGAVVSEALFLRAAGVSKVFGGSRVLRGLDATFAGGRAHVIEGPNGSGKSTLLSIFAGRLAATSGRALLQRGEVAVAEGRALRSVVAWLGHDLGMYGDLSAFENVALHARLRGLDASAAWSTSAETFAIDGLRDRRVRELSRGQRQRVALARTMLGRPEVLLLDEPSTGLDTSATDRLVTHVRTIVGGGTLVVLVTHDPALASSLEAERWVMRDGRLDRAT